MNYEKEAGTKPPLLYLIQKLQNQKVLELLESCDVPAGSHGTIPFLDAPGSTGLSLIRQRRPSFIHGRLFIAYGLLSPTEPSPFSL
jgi:hypothetical protein